MAKNRGANTASRWRGRSDERARPDGERYARASSSASTAAGAQLSGAERHLARITEQAALRARRKLGAESLHSAEQSSPSDVQGALQSTRRAVASDVRKAAYTHWVGFRRNTDAAVAPSVAYTGNSVAAPRQKPGGTRTPHSGAPRRASPAAAPASSDALTQQLSLLVSAVDKLTSQLKTLNALLVQHPVRLNKLVPAELAGRKEKSATARNARGSTQSRPERRRS
jgi:hypothetical protein